jgi:hypothetical protein
MTVKEGNEDDASNTLEEINEIKQKIGELRRKHQIFDKVQKIFCFFFIQTKKKNQKLISQFPIFRI